MRARRIEKINALIKREISKFILRNFEFPEGSFVTVTNVKTSNDLKEAKVLISIFPKENTKKIFPQLKKNRQLIQNYLSKTLVIKQIPKIKILIDTNQEDQIEKIEKLINKLKKI